MWTRTHIDREWFAVRRTDIRHPACLGALAASVLLFQSCSIRKAEDTWGYKGSPPPLSNLARLWSVPIPSVGAVTAGDWDMDGSPELLALVDSKTTGKKELLVIGEDGALRSRVLLPNALTVAPGLCTIQWAEIRRGQGAICYHGGAAFELYVVGTDGAMLWGFPPIKPKRGYEWSDEHAGIRSACWVDIDGDGIRELLVGCARGGLYLLSDKGKTIWRDRSQNQIWAVAGIDAKDGRPALAFCAARGPVRAYNASGELDRVFHTDCHVMEFHAAEMNEQGRRQVVSILWERDQPAYHDYAVASDLAGNTLWRFPVNSEGGGRPIPRLLAADITGDGTKEWIIHSAENQLTAVDIQGQVVACFTCREQHGMTWGTLPRPGKKALVVIGGVFARELVAYTIDANQPRVSPGDAGTRH